jgi:hypothetical protein
MFAWLDELAPIFQKETQTIFVLRAHPDETRRGKESQESVAAWIRSSGVHRLSNVVFIGPDEPVSSYDLIRASRFVLLYNSSVGLEASILGIPALCAGRARFTEFDAAFAPRDVDGYWRRLREFLAAARPEIGAGHTANARAFLYSELFSRRSTWEFWQPIELWGWYASRRSLNACRRPRLQGDQRILRRPFLLAPTPAVNGVRGLPVRHDPTPRTRYRMKIEYEETTKDLQTRIAIHDKYGSRDIDAWMLDLLQPAQGSAILDVACGGGKQLQAFHRFTEARRLWSSGRFRSQLDRPRR